ncbi:MAG TPA: hypothetical protein VFP47_06215, partial [Pyrinomonadaceae bacterium]|nr:hypothetical protein [Pyrinomonadaceae bacterium]
VEVIRAEIVPLMKFGPLSLSKSVCAKGNYPFSAVEYYLISCDKLRKPWTIHGENDCFVGTNLALVMKHK